MNLPVIKGNKKEKKHYTEEGFLESLSGIAKATLDSAKNDLLIDGTSEAWDELLIPDSNGKKKTEQHGAHGSHGGDLSAGHELDLSHLSEKAQEITEMGREYMAEVVKAGERGQA